jgi:hypothetical protein
LFFNLLSSTQFSFCWFHPYSASGFFVLFCFLAILGFELSSELYHLSYIPSSFLLLLCFELGLTFMPEPSRDLDPPTHASCRSEITGIHHHTQLFVEMRPH